MVSMHSFKAELDRRRNVVEEALEEFVQQSMTGPGAPAMRLAGASETASTHGKSPAASIPAPIPLMTVIAIGLRRWGRADAFTGSVGGCDTMKRCVVVGE